MGLISSYDLGNFLLLVCFLFTLPLATSAQDNSRRAFGCFGLCVSKCILAQKGTINSCSASCKPYTDSSLCNSTSCWKLCKDLSPVEINTSSELLIPNVAVSFLNLNPRIVDVRWAAVPGAKLFVVAWRDADDQFGTWNITDQSVVTTTSFQFHKPILCPQYQFSVLPIGADGLGSWSQPKVIDSPAPVADNVTAFKKLVSLRNETKGIVAIIEFGLPAGWTGDDILFTDNSVAVVRCEDYQGIVPQAARIPGELKYEVVFPHVDFMRRACLWFFVINKVTSKCGKDAVYPVALSDAGPGWLFINISCDHVENMSCPLYCPPFNCRVEDLDLNVNIRKPESSCNTTVFDVDWRQHTANKSQCPIEGYILHYSLVGEDDKDTKLPLEDLFGPKKTLRNLRLEKSVTSWTSPALEGDRRYSITVCAVYGKDPDLNELNFNITDSRTVDGRPICRAAGRSVLDKNKLLAICLPIVLGAIAVALVISFICFQKQRKQKEVLDKMAEYGYYEKKGNDYVFIERPNVKEKWELDRERLILYNEDKPLGSGAFGRVYKGKVHGKILTHKDSQSALAPVQEELRDALVAVKQCFEYADAVMKSEFRQEIELMKQLGHHPHLVNMLHCVTETEPLCLIVEFCEHGDLRRYLRENRAYMLTLERMGVDYVSQEVQEEIDDSMILCIKDLVLFSFQISDGLEYLHQKCYIHRDIAARNVLIDKNRICKIGDFGLCRFVNNDPIYMSKGGKVPIKWMALESLKEFRFTFENDVWAFGVLLFEIITLGGTPYPDVLPADGDFQKAMIDYLDSGKRMEQPDNCPDDMYSVMLDCWKADASSRPGISVIREQLRRMLETIAKERDDMYLDPNRSYYNVSDAWDEEPQVTADMLLNGDVGDAETILGIQVFPNKPERAKLELLEDSGCENRGFMSEDPGSGSEWEEPERIMDCRLSPPPPVPPKSTNLCLSNSYVVTTDTFRSSAQRASDENSCESGIGSELMFDTSCDSGTQILQKTDAKIIDRKLDKPVTSGNDNNGKSSSFGTAERFGPPPVLPSFEETQMRF